jgi:hypothetical protein
MSEQAAARYAAGQAAPAEAHLAQAEKLKAEIDLLRGGGHLPVEGGKK